MTHTAGNTPAQKAKALLRCTSTGTLSLASVELTAPKYDTALWTAGGEVTAPMTSDLSGAPLMFVADETVSISAGPAEARIGALKVAGHLELLDGEEADLADARFAARHGENKVPGRYARLKIERGTLNSDDVAVELDAADLLTEANLELQQYERRAVDHMNDDHLDAIKSYAEVLLKEPEANWTMASLDMDGLDLVADGRFARLWFDPPLVEPEEIKKRLVDLAIQGRQEAV